MAAGPVDGPATGTAGAAGAADLLAQELVTAELLGYDERFLQNDRPNYFAILDWLAEVEGRNGGVVSEATLGTGGSEWLLARKLGDTLQATVEAIAQGAETSHAFNGMMEFLSLNAVMSSWRLNDRLQFERVLKELTRREDGRDPY